MVHDAVPGKPVCPKCKSGDIDGIPEERIFYCLDCGWEWSQ